MRQIFSIIEGHGEVFAVPILLKRLVKHLGLEPVETSHHLRIPRARLVKAIEFENAIALAAIRTKETDLILVLLDADDDCPRDLSAELLQRAQRTRSDRRVSVVLAKREYEAWLVAGVQSLSGYRNLAEAKAPPYAEDIRDTKGWLTKLLPPGSPYKETIDQAKMTERLDLELARRASSFQKLCRELIKGIPASAPSA